VKDVQVGVLRSEQPPEDDQVMPDRLNIEVAVAWLIFVTAAASGAAAAPVAPPSTTAAGAARRRVRALRAERSFMRGLSCG
jgi:hypothetical protein